MFKLPTGFVVAVVASAILAGTGLAWSSGGKDKLQTVQGRTIFQWHQRAVKLRVQRDHARTVQGNVIRENRRLLREFARVQKQPGGSLYGIRLASSAFGVDYNKMVAVARCETGGSFNPYSRNPSSSASGVFQFLDSTWARAGLAGFSVFDPVANSLAAARLVVRDGGWREWACG